MAATNPTAKYFVRIGNQVYGPLSAAEVRQKAAIGLIGPEALIRIGVDGAWTNAGRVQGLFPAPTVATQPAAKNSTSPSPPAPRFPPMPLPPPAMVPPDRPVLGAAITFVARILGAYRADNPRRNLALVATALAVAVGGLCVGVVALTVALMRHGSAESRPQTVAGSEQAVRFQQEHSDISKAKPKTEVAKTVASNPPLETERETPVLGLEDLTEIVRPSVVQVNMAGPEGAATGSGFLVDIQGTIVTNFHVIQDATGGTVTFSDKTIASIVGYLGVWPDKDIALIRVQCPPNKLHPLSFVTAQPRIGGKVATFGSPLGFSGSVSDGIISGIRRGDELGLDLFAADVELIQTTAPTSHGNSGGPLVNMKGAVVGVTTLTFAPAGGENLNFAVSAIHVQSALSTVGHNVIALPVRTPQDAWAHLRRGGSSLRKGDNSKAISEFTKGIRLDPKNAFAYTCRGVAYENIGDWDKAIADYTQAIRLKPNDAANHYFRGMAHGKKGDHDKAIADYTEAIRLKPDDAASHYSRGMAHGKKGEHDKAITDYTQAIRLKPDDVASHYFRGMAHGKKGEHDKAIADYTEAIRLKPDDADAYFQRGFAYWEKDDWDKAIADHTQAIRLKPDDATMYYFRGWAYERKGQKDMANKDFAKAKELGYKF